MEQKLSIITLGVSALERSREFYLDGLGWKASNEDMEGIVFISMNGFTLALYPHDALAEDANVQEDRSNFRGFTLAHNTNSPEEVDEVLIFAKQAGAKIIKPGQKVFWGGYSGYFADPDAFLWEVAYNPFIEF